MCQSVLLERGLRVRGTIGHQVEELVTQGVDVGFEPRVQVGARTVEGRARVMGGAERGIGGSLQTVDEMRRRWNGSRWRDRCGVVPR